jgi:alginate O-acetyltransferase complex protein AlgI
MAATFSVVTVAWVFFRAQTLADAGHILRAVFTRPFRPLDVPPVPFPGLRTAMLLLLITCLVAVEWSQRRHPHVLAASRLPRPVRWVAYTGLIWALLIYSSESTSFIYFQF